ncbi:cutinase, partial [Plectosphaerella plurivora]
MYIVPLIPLAASLVAALPVGQAEEASLQVRQFGGGLGGGNTRNDVEDGGACPRVILVYARATGERGNLGILGGVIGSALESEFDSVWVQGVGGAYTAGIADNMQPDGASPAAITEMVGLFNKAAQACPDANIVTGGYSQGSALCAAAVRDVSPDVRSKIAGAVLFGYTKNAQNNGGIPDYPDENVEVFCNAGDMVCTGSLVVAAPHFAYQSSARGPAPEFLAARIRAAGS